MQKHFRRESIADEGQRCGRRGHQAHIAPRQCEHKAEEGGCHSDDAKKKIRVGEDAVDHGAEPRAPPHRVQVAHSLHRARHQNVAHDREEDYHQNSAPGVKVLHRSTPPEAARAAAPLLTSCGRSAELTSASWACVNDGPPATKPTPLETSAMPSQRSGLTCSCNANFATRASKTYPSEVAGIT